MKKFYLVDAKNIIVFKWTVEATRKGYIATFWDPSTGYEVDRQVVEFETESAALIEMLESIVRVQSGLLTEHGTYVLRKNSRGVQRPKGGYYGKESDQKESGEKSEKGSSESGST